MQHASQLWERILWPFEAAPSPSLVFPLSIQALGTSAMSLRLLAETLEKDGKTTMVSSRDSLVTRVPQCCGRPTG